MKHILSLLFLILFTHSLLHARCGKVDVGVAWIRIDVLESEKTVKRIDMPAFKSDATIVLVEGYGFALKPNLLYGKGDHSELISGGIGFGHCTPFFNGCLVVTPSVGINWANLSTLTDIPQFWLEDVREHFRSVSPYVCLEATYTFLPCWRVCGLVQYAWSRTHTTIKGLGKSKSKPTGFNFAGMIEYDFYECFSVNLGAAYNLSLTKEKHGLRAVGVKLGLAYWF